MKRCIIRTCRKVISDDRLHCGNGGHQPITCCEDCAKERNRQTSKALKEKKRRDSGITERKNKGRQKRHLTGKDTEHLQVFLSGKI